MGCHRREYEEMRKDIEGCVVAFILIAEDAMGRTVVCESYGSKDEAVGAWGVLDAPTVCLLKQTCTTEIIAHKER